MCTNIPSEIMFSYISNLMMTQKVDICLSDMYQKSLYYHHIVILIVISWYLPPKVSAIFEVPVHYI